MYDVLIVYCSQYSFCVSGQWRVSFHYYYLSFHYIICSKQMALIPVLDMLNHSATAEVMV